MLKINLGHDRLIVLPNDRILHDKLHIHERIYDDQIVISPCDSEYWISTDLFKFKIYADRNKQHVIGVCSYNQIPHFSLFCDEIWLTTAKPAWYQDHSNNNIHTGRFRQRHDYINIENGVFRNAFMSKISDAEVVETYAYKTIYLMESSYKKFLEIESTLPRNIIVAEAKQKRHHAFLIFLESLGDIVGVRQDFQRELVSRVTDHYMAIQILASNVLNWQFFCIGGSSNLMCVLPVKIIAMKDQTINESVLRIVYGFMEKRGLLNIPLTDIFKIKKSQLTEVFNMLTDTKRFKIIS